MLPNSIDSLKRIRELYAPLQPTIKSHCDSVSYAEFLPCAELQPFIYCYWELKTMNELSQPFTYRVVTDGCIDIFFDLTLPEENYVMGFCKQFVEFPLNKTFNYVGIRFLPTAFPHFFQVNAADLSNKFQLLKNVNPSFSNFITTEINQKLNVEPIIKKLEIRLFEVMNTVEFDYDKRLYDAINLILDNYGVINLESDMDTGISHRQLRRLFNYYVGDTPKSFSKIVRFQNILKAKPSAQSLKKNKIFYDLGYYDQAHFIKDFKAFYGVTPSKAFGRE